MRRPPFRSYWLLLMMIHTERAAAPTMMNDTTLSLDGSRQHPASQPRVRAICSYGRIVLRTTTDT